MSPTTLPALYLVSVQQFSRLSEAATLIKKSLCRRIPNNSIMLFLLLFFRYGGHRRGQQVPLG